ncbi:hypothetical protein SLS53_000210 [Cytospora paraplurivora]|uniref:Uncharacterized protein n=1 Tax=Cytospora paraplurivora TaxID=2898453 RepID=A0AAN9ULR0_9PEZI
MPCVLPTGFAFASTSTKQIPDTTRIVTSIEIWVNQVGETGRNELLRKLEALRFNICDDKWSRESNGAGAADDGATAECQIRDAEGCQDDTQWLQ